jgi:hypothetical protein
MDYASVTQSISVVVNQAIPAVTTLPTASAIAYGQTLAASTLTGGTVINSITKSVVAGTFAFANAALAPTASGPQNVTFTPQDTTDYAAPSPVSVPVTVTAVPRLSVQPSSINFGTLYLGSIVTKTVTISNTGNAPVTIANPRIAIVQGGDSSEFVTLNFCPASLAAGKSCTMTVTFIAGPFYNPQTAVLTIDDNVAGSPQTIPLSATVINPQAQLSTGSLSYGLVTVGTTSASKPVVLTNTGTTALSITSITVAGTDPGDFTETTACASSLVAGKSCTINVSFKPTAKGSQPATLVVASNAKNSPQQIALSGDGN